MTFDTTGSPLLGLNVERILQAEWSPAPAHGIVDGTHSCGGMASAAVCSSEQEILPASPKVDASESTVDAALGPVYSAVDRTWPSDDSPASFVKNAAAKVVLEAFKDSQSQRLALFCGVSVFVALRCFNFPLTKAGDVLAYYG